MKATKLLLAAALFTGLAALSFAGPGPQFWAQQAKNQQAQATKADVQVKTQPAAQVAACANCNCAAMKKS
jgi:hypothetical protein